MLKIVILLNIKLLNNCPYSTNQNGWSQFKWLHKWTHSLFLKNKGIHDYSIETK